MPIEVQVQGPVGREQAIHQRQALIEKVKIRVEIGPVVAISFSQLPLVRLARILAAPDAGGILAIGEERRIGVDQIDLTFVVGQ